MITGRNYNRRRLCRWYKAPRKYTYQAEFLRQSLEQAAEDIGLLLNAIKTEYMCFKQEGPISILSSGPLKSIDKFTYPGSSVSSSERDVRLAKVWKSALSDKI